MTKIRAKRVLRVAAEVAVIYIAVTVAEHVIRTALDSN
jgi:hypothetical protein